MAQSHRAIAHLRDYLAKAAGDRGGHVVGTTRTGHPIYASTKGDAAVYSHFTARDHAAAAAVHDAAASASDHASTSAHHSSMANSHRVRYEQVRQKEGLKRPPGQGGIGHTAPPEDHPTPEDGEHIGKIYTGRAVYANRQAHHYQDMTAAEAGEMSRVHEAARQKAMSSGNKELADHHGNMRHAHVQAAMSISRTEAHLRGHDRPRFGHRAANRSSSYA